ncbi:hypothetical protein QJS10_CPB21g00336 [Acorus calamus]|uniref:Glyoxalase At5g48480-like N-terminal domain-containing protein n=1 Tax=Acorus calamus TaxID=4465 RepID=A0AAV9C538_ACOCL|nr:hypothetical protein QJS10_CPB21g00336 [Acorus calamus]
MKERKRLRAANGGCGRDVDRSIAGPLHPTVDVNHTRPSDAMDRDRRPVIDAAPAVRCTSSEGQTFIISWKFGQKNCILFIWMLLKWVTHTFHPLSYCHTSNGFIVRKKKNIGSERVAAAANDNKGKADETVKFYKAAFGAEELNRISYRKKEGGPGAPSHHLR